jgi:torulene dioxygenase
MAAVEIGYNKYFVPEKDLKYVPPYLGNTPETTEEVKCPIIGHWPKWLDGTLIR